MNKISGITDLSEPITLTRRLFAGGTIAALATAGLTFPAAAQGLKDVDDDDSDDRDDETGEIPEEWEEIGITSEYSYESPQFGYTVEWEDPWMVDPEEPGGSDTAMEMDELFLLWEPGRQDLTGVSLLGIPSEPGGVGRFGEFLLSAEGRGVWFTDTYDVEDVLANIEESAFEILFSMSTTEDGEFVGWVFILGTEITPDQWVIGTMAASDDLLEDVFGGLTDKVFVDGENVVRLTTWRDIERAIR